MEHVDGFFKALGLGEYVPALEMEGYDDLGIILAHDDEDFDIFGPLIGLKPGHLFRLKKAVSDIKKARTGEVTVHRVPIIPLHGNVTATNGATVHDGPAAAACAAACAAAAPTTHASTATKRKAPHNDLPEYCKTSQEVRLESL